MKTVFINPERCIGCKQCQVACAVEHSTIRTACRITGFRLAGDIRAAGIYRTLMNKGTDVGSLRDRLLEPGFGMGYIPDQGLLQSTHMVMMQ